MDSLSNRSYSERKIATMTAHVVQQVPGLRTLSAA